MGTLTVWWDGSGNLKRFGGEWALEPKRFGVTSNDDWPVDVLVQTAHHQNGGRCVEGVVQRQKEPIKDGLSYLPK